MLQSPQLVRHCACAIRHETLIKFITIIIIFIIIIIIIQSQAAFVNCLYVARLTIVHSKTQIKFPLLLLLLLLLL